ncbi:MAG: nucleotidyltransferase family protein [Candidatus Hydrogenedentes bacterium]|nr:nucleotidyltransferase family protein [Candidatus Hydrogenedentota bacterium]
MEAIPHITVDNPAIAAFCRKWNVRELSLFGSVLRDDFRPESDIDILVELAPGHGLDLFDWVDMREELKHLFQREVDLVSKGGLKNPIRKKAILSSARVVYAA